MITKVKKLFKNEAVSYLFWGVGATVVNWIVYTVLSFASPYSMVICNSIAWLAAVLFAYITNRFFVFHSKTHGLTALLREFFLFIGARVFTVPAVPSGHPPDFSRHRGLLGKGNRYCADHRTELYSQQTDRFSQNSYLNTLYSIEHELLHPCRIFTK